MSKAIDYRKEARRITQLCADETDSPARAEAYARYSKLLNRVFAEGRLWVPERVALLTPLLLEIEAEIEEQRTSVRRLEAKSGLKKTPKAKINPASIRCSPSRKGTINT